eukprot:4348429-Prymnesium_polylepis.2
MEAWAFGAMEEAPREAEAHRVLEMSIVVGAQHAHFQSRNTVGVTRSSSIVGLRWAGCMCDVRVHAARVAQSSHHRDAIEIAMHEGTKQFLTQRYSLSLMDLMWRGGSRRADSPLVLPVEYKPWLLMVQVCVGHRMLFTSMPFGSLQPQHPHMKPMA